MRLPHTCTIRTVTEGTPDSTGQPTTSTSDTANVQCRLETLTGGAELQQAARAVVASHRLYLAKGATITEDDQIVDVADADGTALLSLADVELVDRVVGGRSVHHIEAYIQEVRT